MKLKILLALIVSTGLSTTVMANAVYTAKCAACHTTGAAGAPKLGDKAAWANRLGKGVDGLLATVISGKGAMPPRGACADCSDADLKAAIQYMIK